MRYIKQEIEDHTYGHKPKESIEIALDRLRSRLGEFNDADTCTDFAHAVILQRMPPPAAPLEAAIFDSFDIVIDMSDSVDLPEILVHIACILSHHPAHFTLIICARETELGAISTWLAQVLDKLQTVPIGRNASIHKLWATAAHHVQKIPATIPLFYDTAACTFMTSAWCEDTARETLTRGPR